MIRRRIDKPPRTPVKVVPIGKTVQVTSDELRAMSKAELFKYILSLGYSVDGLSSRTAAIQRLLVSAVKIENM